jgi:hypothetical protein
VGRVSRPIRVSLAAQLVALSAAVALVAGSIVGVVLIERGRSVLRDEILQKTLSAANLAAALSAAYVSEAQADAQELANRPVVRAGASRGDLRSLTPDLESYLAGHPHLVSVGVADLTGITRASGLEDKSSVEPQRQFGP